MFGQFSENFVSVAQYTGEGLTQAIIFALHRHRIRGFR